MSDIAVRVAGRMKKKAETIEEYLGQFPPEAISELEDVIWNASQGPLDVPGIGTVQVSIEGCSEGTDRGGYVPFVTMPDSTRLEADMGDGKWLFDGRMSKR